MPKKNDMDHMKSILGHAASQVTSARMPMMPVRGTPNPMPKPKPPSTTSMQTGKPVKVKYR